MRAFLVLYIAVNDSDAESSDKRCTCIIQCMVVSYSSSISTSRLAVSDILLRMSHKLYSSTVPAFANAQEIAERVKSEHNMQDTVD